jgi:hypothetical protein
MPLTDAPAAANPRTDGLRTSRPAAEPPGALPVERRLPSHRGKVARISEQIAGLSEDVREIVELRIQLVKREVMDQIEGRISTVKGQALVGALAAMTGIFLLLSIGLGLGMLLGHAFWGFLIVTGVFLIATLVAKRKFAPGPVRVEHDRETGKVHLALEETPADHERRKSARNHK